MGKRKENTPLPPHFVAPGGLRHLGGDVPRRTHLRAGKIPHPLPSKQLHGTNTLTPTWNHMWTLKVPSLQTLQEDPVEFKCVHPRWSLCLGGSSAGAFGPEALCARE